jgi:hypothetical protein
MSRRFGENASQRDVGERTDAKTVRIERKSRGLWQTYVYKNGLERTSVQRPMTNTRRVADVEAEVQRALVKRQCQTHGGHHKFQRALSQSPMTNTRMS